MANISCARSIDTKKPWGRAGLLRTCVPGALLCALSGQGLAQPAATAGLAPARVNADPVFPFSNEIAAFAKANEAGPAVRDATLFLGSSSIRLWDIRGSFPDYGTVNRGFGGATTADVLHYYARLLPRVAPRSIVIYVGENDLAAGAAPEQVAHAILTLLKRLRADYPKARIVYLSLKPSPIRWTLWPKMAAVNMTVAARTRAGGFDYLDVGSVLLARDGLPDASLFGADGLHMNARGYERWTRLVDAWIDRAQIAAAASPAGS